MVECVHIFILCKFSKLMNSLNSYLSPTRRQRHQHCTLVDCFPFGRVRSCAAKYVLQLSTLITECQLYMPQLSVSLLSATSMPTLNAIMGQEFPLPSSELNDALHGELQDQIRNLQGFIEQLSRLLHITSNISLRLNMHEEQPAHVTVKDVLRSLHSLQECVVDRKMHTEGIFFRVLDAYPQITANKLQTTMQTVRKWLSIYTATLTMTVGK